MAAPNPRSTRLTSLGRDHVWRYIRATGWIVRDGLVGEGGRATVVVLAGLLSVVTTGMSLWAVFTAAAQVEAGHPKIVLWGHEFGDAGARSLILVVVVTLVVGLISQVFYLLSEVQVHRLGRNYNERCIRRVLEIATRPDAETLFANVTDRDGKVIDPGQIAAISSQHCGYAMLYVVQFVLPLITSIASLVALVWIDAVSTVIVMTLVAIYAVPMLVINRAVSIQQHDSHHLMAPVFGRVRRWMDALRGGTRSLADRRIWETLLVEDDKFDRLGDALFGRLLAHSKVAFINSVFFLICVCGVIIGSVVRGGSTLTAVAAFLIVLRYAWWGLRMLTSSLVTVHRFFLDYEAMGRLVKAADATPAPEDVPALETPVRVPVEPLPDTDDTPGHVTFEPGGIAMAYVAAEDPSYALDLLTPWIADATVRRRDRAWLLPGLKIIETALGSDPPPRRVEPLRIELRRLGVLDELEALPQGLQTMITPNTERKLSREAVTALVAAHLFHDRPAVVLVAMQGLVGLEPGFLEAYVDALLRHAVVLVDTGLEPITRPKFRGLRARVDQVLLLTSGGVLHGGDAMWLERYAPQIDAILADQVAREEEQIIVAGFVD